MAGRNYFGKHFIGMNISFTEPRPSTWKLVTKVNEKHRQLDESDYESYKTPSSAWALFVCQNANVDKQSQWRRRDRPDEDLHADQGSEFERPEERAKQATETLDSIAQSEFDALKRLTEKRCESTPTLLGYKRDKQDDHGLVPGRYIFYPLMTRFPWIRLGGSIEMNSLFWSLPDTTRDPIREAFKVAYTCVSHF